MRAARAQRSIAATPGSIRSSDFEHARDRLERDRVQRVAAQRGVVVRERLLGLARELEAATEQRAVRGALRIALAAREAALERAARGRVIAERDERLAVRAERDRVVRLEAQRLGVEARGDLGAAAPARRIGAGARDRRARRGVERARRDLERRARRELGLVVAAELRGELRARGLRGGVAGRALDRRAQQLERCRADPARPSAPRLRAAARPRSRRRRS